MRSSYDTLFGVEESPSLELVPGRPGRPVTTRGKAAAGPSPLPPAGYEARALDETLSRYVSVCERTIRHADDLGAKVTAVLQALAASPAGPDAVEDAERMSILFERLSKAGLNLVKATDELTRLRSFVSGGPDRRADLTVAGEVQLRAIVLAGIKALGWAVADGDGSPVLEGN